MPTTDADPATADWATIHQARAALADDLQSLDLNAWATPSPCTGWSVEDVVAHLTAAATIGRLRWMTSMLGSRFDADRHNLRRLREQRGPTPADTLRRFRAAVDNTIAPTDHLAAWLGEVVVHGQDVRRPLGLGHEPPVETVTPVARFFAARDFTVASHTMAGDLALAATDGPFAVGDGPSVRGPTLALTMTMAGRDGWLDELSGPGVSVLRSRLDGRRGTWESGPRPGHGRGTTATELLSSGGMPRPPTTPNDADLDRVVAGVPDCRRCPRLVAHREAVARDKRAAFADQDYWGRGVPGFGDRDADVVVVGLAPAAHGANRTGRMFTGDRSGDMLFASLHRLGLANQSTATAADDGLVLTGAWVTSPVKCAPPGNQPTTTERDTCVATWLVDEVAAIDPPVLVALGGFAWDVCCRLGGWEGRKPRFSHGAEATLADGRHLVASYHVSQLNTFTGRLTDEMLDEVFARALVLAKTTA